MSFMNAVTSANQIIQIIVGIIVISLCFILFPRKKVVKRKKKALRNKNKNKIGRIKKKNRKKKKKETQTI